MLFKGKRNDYYTDNFLLRLYKKHYFLIKELRRLTNKNGIEYALIDYLLLREPSVFYGNRNSVYDNDKNYKNLLVYFDFHTHPSDTCFSYGDIIKFTYYVKEKRVLDHFVYMVECPNIIFSLYLEDIQLYKNYLKKYEIGIYDRIKKDIINYSNDPIISGKTELEKTLFAIKSFFLHSKKSGVVIYQSNDKINFFKLN